MIDVSPMSRVEKQLRKLLGQSITTDPPQSRIEFLLQEIIDGGGIGGGSYKIKDQYATLADLEAAHPVGADGDAYLVGDPTHIYVWLDDQQAYADGGLFAAVPGLDGVGIASIDKTSTAGLVDTYTITYTDGNTDTFTVTNGAQGEPGADGEDGVGITSIAKSGTVGNVDTYTITLTNGDTYNFTVTNGEGVGVPEGGTTGQVLVKKSNTDYDTEWANAGAGEGVPTGGTQGQILAKKTNADYDTEWVNNSGGSDYSSEIESLASETSELASETGSLSAENSTQTSELASLSAETSEMASEIGSLSTETSELASDMASTSTAQSELDSNQNVSINSLTSENSTQTSEIESLASAMSSMSVSEITSQLDSLSAENSLQTSEIGSMASEMSSMSVSDITSQLSSLSAENSTQTSEIGSLSQSMSEMASAASSTSTAQSEYDSTQDVSLASLSTENSTQSSELGSLSAENSSQTSEIVSLSTAASELGSEVDVIGSEVADKQDALVEGPGIDIDSSTNEIKTETVVFTGTLQEWNQLSTAEKLEYTHAAITDDTQSGAIDLAPTKDSMHAVTSGGVYNKTYILGHHEDASWIEVSKDTSTTGQTTRMFIQDNNLKPFTQIFDAQGQQTDVDSVLIDRDLSWKLVKEETGRTSIALPQNFHEIFVSVGTSTDSDNLTWVVPKEVLTTSNKIFINGWNPGGAACYAYFLATTTTVQLYEYINNGTSIKDSAHIKVYYR